jgi:hypothetical protein
MKVKLEKADNKSGDAASAPQGFGKISSEQPPLFDPASEQDAAADHFESNGFAVLQDCLDSNELAHLNEFFDRTQIERAESWGLTKSRRAYQKNAGIIFSQPLLDYPELDPYTQHPSSFPLVARLLGGVEHARFSEFNFREAPEGAGLGAMNFHHDAVVADRFERKPYMPSDWLCAIHYLTDVEPGTPSFCVVPGSFTYRTLEEAYEGLGEKYREVPIYGKAGTCVLYDTALFHTRLDGDGVQARRTWHQYYARGGWLKSSLPISDKYVRPPTPVLTNWNVFPERLAMHPDPEKRLFFSHWNTAQCEWVASGFSDEVRDSMPRGHK